MAEARTPRDLVSREKETRAVYVPPTSLPDPNPRPGIVHRWVMTAVLGKADPTNVSRRMREGWVPVKIEDYPELQMAGMPATGNVEIGGLMLCAMPAETAKLRDDYYRKQAQAQMESVDNNFMSNNDPRMPLFTDRKSTVTRGANFGSGSK
jgi:hypothetical protein